MENKQTAVDWLAQQVNSDCLNSTFINPQLIEQAKQMEQKQIVEAFHEGMQTNFDPNYGIALNYYESTYGK